MSELDRMPRFSFRLLSQLSPMHQKLRELLRCQGFLASLYEGEPNCDLGFVCIPNGESDIPLRLVMPPLLEVLNRYCCSDLQSFDPTQPPIRVESMASAYIGQDLVMYLERRVQDSQSFRTLERLSLRFVAVKEKRTC